MQEKTFLEHLVDKRANVQKIGEQTGANVGGGIG